MRRSRFLIAAPLLFAGTVHAAAPMESVLVVAPAVHGVTRATSEDALRQLTSVSPAVHALWRPGQVGPSVLSGLRQETVGVTPSARALDFVARHSTLLGVPVTALRVSAVRPARQRTVVVLQQVQSLATAVVDVWQHTMALTLDQTGRVIAVSNDAGLVGAVAPATISLKDAQKVAVGAGEAGGTGGTRVVVVGGAGAFEAAVFLVAKLGTLEAVAIVVNLHDGTVSSRQSAVRH